MGTFGMLTSRLLLDIFGDPLPTIVWLVISALLIASAVWAYRDWKRGR